MARVLFINAGSEGHINPTVGVVQELISRGEEVVYFTVETFRDRVEKTGATVLTFDGEAFIKAFLSGGRTYLLERINGLLQTADVVIPSVLEQIEGKHFDYMIHDSMFGCGRFLAQILKLPAISSCTSFAHSKDSFERMLEHLSKDIPPKTLEAIREDCRNITTKLKENYDVEIGSPYEVFCNPAPLTIIYTTREFQPSGDTFDPSYKFVGPSISLRSSEETVGLSAIKGENLIYISLGTVFNQATEFYKLCFEAFGDSAYTVIMSIGQRTQKSALGRIPQNFTVENYVPQTEVLKEADLFITHGGMNSANEGLYYGVPLLVIPQSADQPMVAQQVVKSGAGKKLLMEHLTVPQLRETADAILKQPSFRQQVKKISASFQKAGGYQQAVDEIFKFKNEKGI
ncbi:glycosyltransferase, MGT family [Fictibacillus solisalsi]|uniref:Glycosyltransferase, MGT family n=1 Tax=Fictibacillus solisalsi TaxID=459525 RepID=A0A1G9TTU3_9BACL|nr:macrolide family glycosyltransferase [Fictibacillus solisalsi]SDM51136.1 glycosyltransferase, MGT family [Fictibacillus solisalsi]